MAVFGLRVMETVFVHEFVSMRRSYPRRLILSVLLLVLEIWLDVWLPLIFVTAVVASHYFGAVMGLFVFTKISEKTRCEMERIRENRLYFDRERKKHRKQVVNRLVRSCIRWFVKQTTWFKNLLLRVRYTDASTRDKYIWAQVVPEDRERAEELGLRSLSPFERWLCEPEIATKSAEARRRMRFLVAEAYRDMMAHEVVHDSEDVS